jgi:L-amino acid N-acyltransferase YncA
MTVTFQWESCRKLFAEPNLWDLLRAHHDELGVTKEDCPLDPDFERFIQLEALGLFFAWAARQEGKLVGYIGFFVQPHLHYRSTMHAVEDLFLLEKEHRKGLTGYRMFKEALSSLEEMGVKRVLCHSKVHFAPERGGLVKFFTRLGFVHTDNFYVKILGLP